MDLKSNITLINGALFSVFAFIGRGISFILLILLASYIPPSDYGKLSLFNTVVMLLGFFLTFSTSGYFSISFFKEEKKVFHQDFTFVILMLLFTSGIIALIFLSFGDYLANLAGITNNLLWWALVISFTNVPFQLHMDYYRLQEKVYMYGLLNLGNAVLNAFFSIMLVISFTQGWMGRINAHIGISIFLCFLSIVFFVRRRFFDFHIKKERMKIILLWGLPQIPHLTTTWIRQGCDQYIINFHYSTQEVGLFSFALNMVGIITMIGMAFNSSNSVSIYQILSNKTSINKRKTLNNNTRIIFYVYVIATVLILLATILFVPYFLPKYIDSLPFFALLSFYGLMVCIYFLYCNYLFYYGYTKSLMYITFGTSLFHLMLSLLITQYSLYYTALVYILSQSICVALVYFFSKKILSKELGNN